MVLRGENTSPVHERSFFAAVRAWFRGYGEPITIVPNTNPDLMRTETTQELMTSFHKSVVETFTQESQEPATVGFTHGPDSICDLSTQSNRSVPDFADALLSEAELEEMDSNNAFVIPTLEGLNTIDPDAIKATMAASEEMESRCICELSCPRSDIIRQQLTDQFLRAAPPPTRCQKPASLLCKLCS